jgi:hypothetical protein
MVHLRPRFLQLQAKAVQARQDDGGFASVGRLELGSHAELCFDEAVPRDSDVAVPLGELLAGERRIGFGAPAGEDAEPAYDDGGREAGRVVRTRWPVRAAMLVSAERAATPFTAYRLRVRIENTGDDAAPDASRPEALRTSLIAAHCLLGLTAGSFLSMVDPPEWAAAEAKACRNVRTFPVLSGADGAADLILSSPIILYDHPQIAPESAGDFHDGGEIDELLSLRTLTMTDEEKAEARGTDPRAADIVDRVDTMPPEVMERLHGAIRSLRPAGETADGHPDAGDFAPPPYDDFSESPTERPATPWWDPGADESVSPETDHVVVDGVRIAKGSHVLLRPRPRGTDAHDIFLAGRTATVAAIFLDVDGSQFVAVTIDDDPRAELHEAWGRYHFYRPEEVEPAGDPDVALDADPVGSEHRP